MSQTKQFVVLVLAIMVMLLLLPIAQLTLTQQVFAETGEQQEENIAYTSAIEPDLDCSMHKSEGTALSDVRTVVTARDKYKSHYSVSTYSTFYFNANNINQKTMNEYYNKNNSDKVSGSCSLVAMTMLVESIKDNPYFSVNKNKHQIFAEIKSNYQNVSWTNTYNGGFDLFFARTLENFFSSNGHDVDAQLTVSALVGAQVNNGFVNQITPLSVLSFSSADLTYSGETCGNHSVLYTGCYAYTTTYRERVFGLIYKTVSKQFDVYVICNGWSDYSYGGIGNRMQLLVFDDTASINVVGIPDLFEHIL